MVKKYYVTRASDLGHLPKTLYFLDANVLINASCECRHPCVRIVESNLPYAYTDRVKKEVLKIGNREYGGLGLDYLQRVIERSNYSKVSVSGERGFVPLELRRSLSVPGLSPDDKNMICVLWAGLVRGEDYHVITSDRHFTKNRNLGELFLQCFQKPMDRIHYPADFCRDFDEELRPYTFVDRLRTDVRRAGYDLRRELRS